LSEIVYRPESITRIYAGTGFRIEEKLLLPLAAPGGLITYTVQTRTPVSIEVRFTPVLGLMWLAEQAPVAGNFNPETRSLSLLDHVHGYRAVLISPQITVPAPLLTSNCTAPAGREMAFTLTPDSSGTAVLAWSLAPQQIPEASQEQSVNTLIQTRSAIESEAAGHYKQIEAGLLQIETPDLEVNRAIRWSLIALEQAYVCSEQLGCGYVAGYGPSRIERRPQYAWFFAGDGLVMAGAELRAGGFARVRGEIELILRHQNPGNGMIWHEMSLSAPFLDWKNSPYLFPHVDITFQFLSFLDQYMLETGDLAFLRSHWPQIHSAWLYASSLTDPETGLPRIPPGKEGGNEQTRLVDDLGLSASWVAASAAYSHLAALMGDKAASEDAAAASSRARKQSAP
jgi:hypothetical protein